MTSYALALPVLLALALQDVTTKPESRPATAPSAPGERDGVFLPSLGSEVGYWPKAWREELRVLEVSPPGTVVKKGEVVVRIDVARLKEQIDQARFDVSAAETKLKDTKEENQIADEAEKQELARAELESAQADGKLKNHLEFQIPMKDEDQRLSALSSQYRIDDQKEELAQLEKMYKEDDLTEATEELVIKRSKRGLEWSLASNEQSRKRRENEKQFDRSRELETIKLEQAGRQGALSRLRRAQAVKGRARAIEVARAERALDAQKRKLADHESDLAALTFEAPRDGILVHGTGEEAAGTQIKRGGSIPSFQTFMVVAPPGEVRALLSVPEESLPYFRVGQKVEVSCPRVKGVSMAGRVERVSPLPSQAAEPGKDALFRVIVVLERGDPTLLPGLRCKVKSSTASTAQADR